MAEADLYQPIKRFLEGQGYSVKGEIGQCDIVAVRGDERPVIVELKKRLNLSLVLQAVDRLAISPSVYVAFRIGKGHSGSWRTQRKQVTSLLRRLGLGLLTVSTRGAVVPVLDPAPYRPRTNARRRGRLLREFTERVGDPEVGGSSSKPRLTAYRQDALRCARELATSGVLKVGVVRERAGVERPGRCSATINTGGLSGSGRDTTISRPRGGGTSPRGPTHSSRWRPGANPMATSPKTAADHPSSYRNVTRKTR